MTPLLYPENPSGQNARLKKQPDVSEPAQLCTYEAMSMLGENDLTCDN